MKKTVFALVMLTTIGMMSCKTNKSDEETGTEADTITTVTDTVISTPTDTMVKTDTTTIITDTVPKR